MAPRLAVLNDARRPYILLVTNLITCNYLV